MIDIDGKFYKIDMDAVMKWVSETPSSEKNINTITTLTYPIIEGEEVVEKEITENKSTLNDIMSNVRYDFFRILLNTLFIPLTNEINQMVTFSLADMSIGQKLAFNTLLAKQIITEVTDFNND